MAEVRCLTLQVFSSPLFFSSASSVSRSLVYNWAPWFSPPAESLLEYTKGSLVRLEKTRCMGYFGGASWASNLFHLFFPCSSFLGCHSAGFRAFCSAFSREAALMVGKRR